MQLQLCATCRRHIRTETLCPFCGDGVAAAGVRATSVGRLSRAMVFAGATLASSAACGGKSKPADTLPEDDRQHDVNSGHGCVDPDPKRIEELEQKKAAAQSDKEKAQIEQELEVARQPMCMPYGAPPRRHRIV